MRSGIMPVNLRPRVNEAKEFLEIAKDFKDSKEIIREALSNSWDAGASRVSIRFDLAPIPSTKKKKIMVEIADDGEGMSSEHRAETNSSEIEGFFNLGDSAKRFGSIGSKGHGTKIYYKSSGIKVRTWKAGKFIEAATEAPPWDTLTKGVVPTYCYDERMEAGRGTEIRIDGFQAKQSEFDAIDPLVKYVTWYTIAGSFGNYFNNPRSVDVTLKPINSATVTVPYGFHFPRENTDLSNGSTDYCSIIGPVTLDCGKTEDGRAVSVQVVGAILGENQRSIVPETYTTMGLWLCKDFIKVERNNDILEKAFGGQYYYRSFLIFANCQQFDLTANRNDIRTDQEEYDLATTQILDFCKTVWASDASRNYFAANKAEEEKREEEARRQQTEARKKRAEERRRERINRYKGRPALVAPGVRGAPAKEPESEAETALLLQAMISSGHAGIDFKIGDYNTAIGVDLVVEQDDKSIPSLKWVELVSSLDKLFQWDHPPEGYHSVVCYQLGKTAERLKFGDGTEAKLVGTSVRGRYLLVVNSTSLNVYVLRELLEK
jgi:hypothetical protein